MSDGATICGHTGECDRSQCDEGLKAEIAKYVKGHCSDEYEDDALYGIGSGSGSGSGYVDEYEHDPLYGIGSGSGADIAEYEYEYGATTWDPCIADCANNATSCKDLGKPVGLQIVAPATIQSNENMQGKKMSVLGGVLVMDFNCRRCDNLWPHRRVRHKPVRR